MIKFTGDLRCDFETATAEITKLKDCILGYQEKVASLQTSIKSLKRSKEPDKKQYTENEKDVLQFAVTALNPTDADIKLQFLENQVKQLKKE